nr:AAA family ATPase [Frankia sp. Cas3]
MVRAPRQTGKTTALRALAEELTAGGRYAALHFSCELGEAAGDDYGTAQRSILQEIRSQAEIALPPELRPPPWPDTVAANLLKESLAAWALVCPRPLVLFFDEIDALRGQSLVSVLRQLRAGFNQRPRRFPASVVLCGLRDVRDSCPRNRFAVPRVPGTASGGDPSRLGTASPFNVTIKSLRLGDFLPEEVRELYAQHTAETGQEFTPDAAARAIELTAGQPWLVNALTLEVVEEIGVPVGEPITVDHVDQAKERLILARATHLDSLAAKLTEPQVRRILEPVLAGNLLALDPYDNDLTYVRDLELITPRNPVQVANPIYREVIARVLTTGVEVNVLADPEVASPSSRTITLLRA